MADEFIRYSASQVETLKVLEKDVADKDVPETLTEDNVFAGSFTIRAKAGNAGTVVSISNSATGPWFAADGFSYSSNEGKQVNFKDLYLQVSEDGDGVVVIYHSTGSTS